MKRAAVRFVELMRPGAQTTLVPFNQTPAVAEGFYEDKTILQQAIRQLRANGGTALYDAACVAIDTLVAAELAGKKAVILLSDGEDRNSRRSAAEAVRRARAAKIPLHVLGFGRELNEAVLMGLAEDTNGTYHHARTAADLHRIFESLAIQLHDDGIDERLELLAVDGDEIAPERGVVGINRAVDAGRPAEEMQQRSRAEDRLKRKNARTFNELKT